MRYVAVDFLQGKKSTPHDAFGLDGARATLTTKPQMAAAQLCEARESGAPDGIVLADAGYGNDSVFRDAVSDLKLTYAVGIQSGALECRAIHRAAWTVAQAAAPCARALAGTSRSARARP